MSKFRKERAADLLQGFLASELRNLSDPVFVRVTLTAIEMSPDLKYAIVFWSAFPEASNTEKLSVSGFPGKEEVRCISKAFDKAKKKLKRRIGEELELRYVPELKFRYDESVETGSRIEFLLSKAGL